MGVRNRNVDKAAGVQSHKLAMNYATQPTAASLNLSALPTFVYYNENTNAWVGYDSESQTHTTLSVDPNFAGTFDDVVSAGKKVTSVAEVEIEKSDAAALLILDQNGAGGCLTLENAGTGKFIAFDDGGVAAIDIEDGGKIRVLAGSLHMNDSQQAIFGTGSDITVQWDGTDLLVDGAAADTIIKIGATNNQDLIIYGDTVTDLITFDTSAELVKFNGFDLRLEDSDILSFGDADDITITWDGTDLLVDGAAADTIIKIGATNNQDLIIYGDTVTDLITFDTSAELVKFNGFDLRLEDSDILEFGDGQDVQMRWDGTDFDILAGADDSVIKFGDGTNSFDIWFFGSAAGDYIEIDASANVMKFVDMEARFLDNSVLQIGTGSDITITWDGTDCLIDGAAADTIIKIGATNNQDLIIYGDTVTDLITFDTSAELVKFNGFDLRLEDSDILEFGDSQDVQMRWDGTDFDILAAADDSVFNFGNGTESFDVVIFGNTASDFVKWDASANKLTLEGDATFVNSVTAKTTNYTVTTADFGKILTTRGAAGAVTFTLPAASGNGGAVVEFYNVADQNMIVAGADEELVVLNDLTADSIAFQTASEKIGGGFRAVCDGTSWIVVPLATETQTVTIVSA